MIFWSLLHHNSSALVLFCFREAWKVIQISKWWHNFHFWWIISFHTNLRAVVFTDHHKYLFMLSLNHSSLKYSAELYYYCLCETWQALYSFTCSSQTKDDATRGRVWSIPPENNHVVCMSDEERDERHIFTAVPHWNLRVVVYVREWFCGPTIQFNQCIQRLNKSSK